MRHAFRALSFVLLWTAASAAQPAALKPGDNLVLRGIPPVPESILTAISPYSEFRQAAFVAWRGTSREMLICTRFGSAYQFHLVNAPGGARSQLTFVPDGIAVTTPADATAVFNPAGTAFVYVRDTGSGKQRYQLFRFDLQPSKTTLLTDGESRNDGPLWSPDGNLLAYTSTKRNGTDRDIYVMDPFKPGSERLVAETQGPWRVLDWSADGSTLLARQAVSSVIARLWLVDVKTGEKREIRTGDQAAAIGDARFGSTRTRVYATTDIGGEFLQMVSIDTGSGAVKPLISNARGDVESFSLSGDRKMIAYVVNEDGVGTLHVFDVAAGRDSKLPPLPAGNVLSVSWAPGRAEVAFDLNSAKHPRDVFSISIASGRVSRWTSGETNGINAEELADAQLIRWTSFDGRMISGFEYRPPKRFTGRRPVMINIHGGPDQQERPRFLGFSNYFLNELGVALIYPNVRGSRGFGRTFLKLDDGMKRPDAVKDIGALLDWIGEQPDLDPQRVMVTGASYGGYMVFAVATTYNGRIRCAFAGSGISNLVTDLQHTSPDGLDERRADYGDERDPAMRAFLEQIAPLAHASVSPKPLFIAHGQNDPRVPVQEAEQMAAAVEKNGTPLWFLVAKDEGHGFGRKPNVDFLFSAWALFVQKYLVDFPTRQETSSASDSSRIPSSIP